MIDAWFRRFKISINLNIYYYVNSISLLVLIKKIINFNCKEKFEWDGADNIIAMRVWKNRAVTRQD
jgi:hypothetical protein